MANTKSKSNTGTFYAYGSEHRMKLSQAIATALDVNPGEVLELVIEKGKIVGNRTLRGRNLEIFNKQQAAAKAVKAKERSAPAPKTAKTTPKAPAPAPNKAKATAPAVPPKGKATASVPPKAAPKAPAPKAKVAAGKNAKKVDDFFEDLTPAKGKAAPKSTTGNGTAKGTKAPVKPAPVKGKAPAPAIPPKASPNKGGFPDLSALSGSKGGTKKPVQNAKPATKPTAKSAPAKGGKTNVLYDLPPKRR